MLNFTNRDVFFFVRNGPKSLCSISKSFAHFSETPTHLDAISMWVILWPIPNPNEVCCWLGRLGVQSQNHGAQVSVFGRTEPTTYETNICAEIPSMLVSVRCVKLGIQAAVRTNHGPKRTIARITVEIYLSTPPKIEPLHFKFSWNSSRGNRNNNSTTIVYHCVNVPKHSSVVKYDRRYHLGSSACFSLFAQASTCRRGHIRGHHRRGSS